MAWLSIIVSVGVTWVASLYKILNSSRSQSNSVFSRTGDKRNVLLVIAHPDDESMFFSPTINYMTSRAHNVFILCMSTGNADGMGNIRKDELYRACAVFKVPPEHVKILDQDGFGKVWNHNLLAKIVEEEVITHAIDLIITFDNYGVSGHCNHRDVHHGICNFLTETSRGNTEAWELISTNIFRKYSGPLDIWLSILSSAMHYPRGKFQCLLNEHPGKSFLAMSEHRSQWVWFRKLFVSFSSYSYVNTLRRINN
ncbi:N-acetylglucosaminyl-phosphatidylinositol de-N-acetylase-like isoform X3 [Mangifera indica]|uniref:N-acetylglucosaminyl-phosphatidylinositol de-N-acetylase-like isoform X3 n=1 Tax=Mangifera indica TaxID=29780 RepID=UPI001CF9376B|nr:N-acetylglucosaminyl-phosphatidylinositol de-N-acetylase-like isoform X3 [Mangifera indica]